MDRRMKIYKDGEIPEMASLILEDELRGIPLLSSLNSLSRML